MKKQFFETVQDHTEADVAQFVEAGYIENVLLTLEYWRFIGEWERVGRIVVQHHDILPESCELYLAECDDIWSRPFKSDHIAVANTEVCNTYIDSLQAHARYYFRRKGTSCIGDQARRQKIRNYRKRAPDRGNLWDVLYAETLTVKNKRHLDRVLELCRPAIRAGDEGLEESELCSIALVIVFNGALAARDAEKMHKALGTLVGRGGLSYNDNSFITFGNLRGTLDPSYDCSKFDAIEPASTVAHLSRLLRAIYRGEDYDHLLPPLEHHLNAHGPQNPMDDACLYLDLTPLSYPQIARVNEDKLCDLTRLCQGSLRQLGTSGKHLAAICHAIGGVPSVGLGDGETNREIRELTESMNTFWGYRGLAHRIFRSEQSHLVPTALKCLSEAYSCTDWSPQSGDPLFLFAFGAATLVDWIEHVLKWATALGDEKSFNQGMEDVVIPALAELPDIEEDECSYSAEARSLLYACATHQFLEPTSAKIEEIAIGFRSMGMQRELIDALEIWMKRWGEDESLHQCLHFQLTWTSEHDLPPRQAIGQLTSKRHFFTSEKHLAEIDSLIDELQEQLAELAKPASHFMLFEASSSPEKRSLLKDATPREILQLGAVCSYLEAPNGQTLLPYKMVEGSLTVEPDGWSAMLKNLLQHRLLQIRPNGPEDSFELKDDGSLSWDTDKVDLAINVQVEGDAGLSQSGILMTLPTIVRKRVLEMAPADLLTLWRSFVRSEAEEYFLRCLSYFELPSYPMKGDAEVFQDTPVKFSFEQLLNLIFNACRAAAGDQKAERRPLAHARNRARSILKSRMNNALDEGWEIGPGFRGDLMPTPYLVKYFAEIFLPLSETVYEKRKPNLSTIEDALLQLKTGA